MEGQRLLWFDSLLITSEHWLYREKKIHTHTQKPNQKTKNKTPTKTFHYAKRHFLRVSSSTPSPMFSRSQTSVISPWYCHSRDSVTALQSWDTILPSLARGSLRFLLLSTKSPNQKQSLEGETMFYRTHNRPGLILWLLLKKAVCVGGGWVGIDRAWCKNIIYLYHLLWWRPLEQSGRSAASHKAVLKDVQCLESYKDSKSWMSPAYAIKLSRTKGQHAVVLHWWLVEFHHTALSLHCLKETGRK